MHEMKINKKWNFGVEMHNVVHFDCSLSKNAHMLKTLTSLKPQILRNEMSVHHGHGYIPKINNCIQL